MQTKIPQEFESLCIGLDVLLTHGKSSPSTQEEAVNQFESKVRLALANYDKRSLENLIAYLSNILAGEGAEQALEEIWMSLKPIKVFFASKQKKRAVSPYVMVFERVLAVARQEAESVERRYPAS